MQIGHLGGKNDELHFMTGQNLVIKNKVFEVESLKKKLVFHHMMTSVNISLSAH